MHDTVRCNGEFPGIMAVKKGLEQVSRNTPAGLKMSPGQQPDTAVVFDEQGQPDRRTPGINSKYNYAPLPYKDMPPQRPCTSS